MRCDAPHSNQIGLIETFYDLSEKLNGIDLNENVFPLIGDFMSLNYVFVLCFMFSLILT